MRTFLVGLDKDYLCPICDEDMKTGMNPNSLGNSILQVFDFDVVLTWMIGAIFMDHMNLAHNLEIYDSYLTDGILGPSTDAKNYAVKQRIVR